MQAIYDWAGLLLLQFVSPMYISPIRASESAEHAVYYRHLAILRMTTTETMIYQDKPRALLDALIHHSLLTKPPTRMYLITPLLLLAGTAQAHCMLILRPYHMGCI